jgi:hypothetical protein
VIAEIEWLYRRQHGARKIIFVDDNFIGSGQKGRDRAAAIARELIRRRLHIGFSLECRVDQVDPELLRLLKSAGLGWVLLGIESGVQRTLDLFDKKTRVATNAHALETLRQLDLQIGVGFILFEPFTTPEELKLNLQFIRQTALVNDMDFLQHFYNTLRVNPGSAIARHLSQAGLLETRYSDALGHFPIGYSFRFVDSRTSFLHRLAEALRVALGERLWAQRVWEGHRHRRLAAWPPDQAVHCRADLESRWSSGSARTWIRAQELLALEAFESLVDEAIWNTCLDEAQVLDYASQILAAMDRLDRQILGSGFRDWFRQLEAGLSASERMYLQMHEVSGRDGFHSKGSDAVAQRR